jgi:K+-sensing histidine kinase KdpD
MLGRLAETQSEKIHVMHSRTDQMIRLVEDILDTSRLESKKFKIQQTPMRIEEIARSALEN